jgi:uncharacterized lipoprotein YmbA
MNLTRQTSDPFPISGFEPVRSQGIVLTFLLGNALALMFLALTGCSLLTPARSTTRSFVLAGIPATGRDSTNSTHLAVGLGTVRLPAYLSHSSIAIRKGTNEIEYLDSSVWAERLDAGLQRVLAANLEELLATGRICLSSWRKNDVSAEVYVGIQQFDVNETGTGMLVARWRILSPGGDKILKSGLARLSRQGPAPQADASGPVATLSELTADFSRQLAQAIRDTSAR